MSALEGRRALITGGAQGLGEALTERLAWEGADVVVGDVNEPGAVATAERVASATGRRVLGARVDVTQPAEVARFFETASDELGGLDVVVSNAAVLIAEPILEADPGKWRTVMNVNLFGNFLVMQAACRVMRGQGSGSIIQINS